MLKGSGVHKNFGWKPVGKYDFTVAANPQIIDPLPCNFERTVLMISQWDLSKVSIKINNDGGANYNYTFHQHGMSVGAASHTQNAIAAAPSIPLNYFSPPNILIETLLQKMGGQLRIISHAVGYVNADNFNLTETGGIYIAAGPYTRIDFVNNEPSDMVGHVELFESVYGF